MSDLEDHAIVEFESINFEDDVIALTDIVDEKKVHSGERGTDDFTIEDDLTMKPEGPAEAAVQLEITPSVDFSETEPPTLPSEQVSEEAVIDSADQVSDEEPINLVNKVSDEEPINLVNKVSDEESINLVNKVSDEEPISLVNRVSDEEPVDLTERSVRLEMSSKISHLSLESLVEQLIEEKYGKKLDAIFAQVMEKILNRKLQELKKKILKGLEDDIDIR